jgi:hypothetical protein
MKPWMYLLIGFGLFGGGIYSYLSTGDFIAEAATASGVVIGLEREQDADGGATYYPRVQFQANGRSYQFKGQVGSGYGTFRVGEQVDVLYDPADPQSARINSFVQLWFFPLFLGVVGSVFTALGASTAFGKARKSEAGEMPAALPDTAGLAADVPLLARASVVERSPRD